MSTRWLHFWIPAEEVEDLVPDECMYPTKASELSALVVIGNFALGIGTILSILMIHVIVVSGVEAYWLTKVTRIPFSCGTLHFRVTVED